MAPPKGWKPTPEQRKRMGDSHRGHKFPPEICKKFSESKMGSKNVMYGKHHSEETKRKLSESMKGRPKSPETVARMKEAHKNDPGPPKGRKHTAEARKRMSEGRKGIVFSPEHIENLRKSHLGKKYSPERSKKRSEYNKTHPNQYEHLRHLRKGLTKPQKLLLEVITALYPENKVESEWAVKVSTGHYKFIDVAIPELLLGFEHDEPAWHGKFRGSEEKDAERHRLIENEGWKLTHYSSVDEFPKIK